jgi:hypothetical protein
MIVNCDNYLLKYRPHVSKLLVVNAYNVRKIIVRGFVNLNPGKSLIRFRVKSGANVISLFTAVSTTSHIKLDRLSLASLSSLV